MIHSSLGRTSPRPRCPKRGHARCPRIGWLALSVLAPACDAPYEPDLQTWPDEAQVGNTGGTGGTSLDETGGSSTSGSAAFPLGGGGIGGIASTTGGTAGASGTLSITGGTSAGGSGAMGGMAAFGGSGAGGASGNGGAGIVGGRGGSGGSGNAGGRMNGGGGNAAGGRSMTGAGGMNDGGAGMAGSGGTSSTANCSLSVKVTTASAGGRYAPRNIGAIWVADQSGNFIRSLEVWAQRRISHLTLWNSATSKAGTPGNRVDIVSQATLSTHQAHTATWACQDFNGMPVPDGTYRVYFEMTDNSSTGPNRFEQFTKGSAPMTLTPADNNNFKAIELSYQP